MAGQGFNAAPPPRPASHNHFGHTNPGNQLYVGNVSYTLSPPMPFIHWHSSFPIKQDGKTSRTCSALRVTLFAPTSTSGQTDVPKVLVPSYLRLPKTLSKQLVQIFTLFQSELKFIFLYQACIMDLTGMAAYWKFER